MRNRGLKPFARAGRIGLIVSGLSLAAVMSAGAQTASPLSQAPMMGQGFTPASPGAPSAAAAGIGTVAPPVAPAAPGPQAQESTVQSGCDVDMSAIQVRRNGAIADLNKLTKNGKAKLDPVSACPKLKTLVGVETEMRNYMVKNKEWCGIPDDVMDQMKAGTAKDSDLATKACALAVQVKKMQSQQAAGAAAQQPRLPTGPL